MEQAGDSLSCRIGHGCEGGGMGQHYQYEAAKTLQMPQRGNEACCMLMKYENTFTLRQQINR